MPVMSQAAAYFSFRDTATRSYHVRNARTIMSRYVVSYVSNFLRHFALQVSKAIQKNSQHFHSRVRLQDKVLLYVNSSKEL